MLSVCKHLFLLKDILLDEHRKHSEVCHKVFQWELALAVAVRTLPGEMPGFRSWLHALFLLSGFFCFGRQQVTT